MPKAARIAVSARRGKTHRRGCIALLVTAFALLAQSHGAAASAWTENAGEGLLIADVTFSGGSHYFDGLGHLLPATLYEKHELTGYLEYGLTDQFMLLLKPDLMSTDVGLPTPAHYAGLGTSEAGLQARVLSLGPAVVSVAGSLRLPGVTAQTNTALIGNTSRDVDARVLLGIPLQCGAWPGFVDLQGAYRLRSSGASAEWHGDLSFGLRPLPRFLILLQSFSTLAESRGTAWFPASSYSKLAVSAVYDVTRSWSVQLGLFSTVGGINALRERGFQAAVWYRF